MPRPRPARPRGRRPAPRRARRRRRSRRRRTSPAATRRRGARPTWRESTASTRLSRLRSMPFATRRGGTTSVGATSACTSTSSGRDALHRAQHARARGAGRLADEARRGVARPRVRPPARISKTPISLVEPKRFLSARSDAVGALALALELQHAVDRVLEHPRPRERTVLGDVPDEDHRRVALARESLEPRGHLAHLSDAAGGAARDRRDAASARSRSRRRRAARASSVASTVSSDVSASTGTSSASAPSRSARRRIWAADSSPLTYSVLPARALNARQRRAHQGALADAGGAADQHDRAGHEPAAEHTVELLAAGREPLDLDRLHLGQPHRLTRPRPGSPRRVACSASTCGIGLLDERVPLAAARAAAHPPGAAVPAVRAGEDGRRTRHSLTLSSPPDASTRRT